MFRGLPYLKFGPGRKPLAKASLKVNVKNSVCVCRHVLVQECGHKHLKANRAIPNTLFPARSLNLDFFPFRNDLEKWMGVSEADVQVSSLKSTVLQGRHIW